MSVRVGRLRCIAAPAVAALLALVLAATVSPRAGGQERRSDEFFRLHYPDTGIRGLGPAPRLPEPARPETPPTTRTRAPDAPATAQRQEQPRPAPRSALPASQPTRPTDEEFPPTKIAAYVGSHPILLGDIAPPVNAALAPYEGKMSAEQLADQRRRLLNQILKNEIDMKILYVQFARSVEPEQLGAIESRLDEEFDRSQLPRLLQQYRTDNPRELEGILRSIGSSVSKERRRFAEQVIAREWLRQQMDPDEEVTHDEMLAYYQAHADEFDYPAKVRWEQLYVSFEKAGGKRAAYRRLAEMGNEVVGGAPLADVARRGSHCPQARHGGAYDWTTQGSLVSDALNAALFSLPVGKLSEIMEDREGFRIVRVVERQEAGRVPFLDAQVEIAKKIKAQRLKTEQAKFLAKARQTVRVWSMFDAEAPVPAGH